MFNLPAETFWFLFPWPFIWITVALIMYFRMKKQDDLEDEWERENEKRHK